MKQPAQADVQRWSDEVARDPKSLAFLPLARAYRRQGLRDAALQLCLRGLESYPAHVEAHGLLALLYLENREHQKAADEWSMVLRIDADNFEALRGMGFCFLEQDQLSRARQMLERAALLRPGDTAVQEALRVLGTRQEGAQSSATRSAAPPDDPWSAPAEPVPAAAAPVAAPAPAVTSQPPAAATLPPAADGAALSLDPAQLFDDLLASGPLLGALLVDAQGLVLAGRLGDGVAGEASVLGAVLGGAIGEATRTASHLMLGNWRGILLEAEHALLHLAPAGPQAVVVLAARRNTPTGWMLRTATLAAERGERYAQEYA
ncbi:MAG TPA: tetratricopeptide repeat protein [Longimicrobiales bacterium]|nr:tetratricopeptide repeat protein [Longimicrobiales bacterium]